MSSQNDLKIAIDNPYLMESQIGKIASDQEETTKSELETNLKFGGLKFINNSNFGSNYIQVPWPNETNEVDLDKNLIIERINKETN